MEASEQSHIPPEIRALAETLNIDVNQLIERVKGEQQSQEQPPEQQTVMPEQSQSTETAEGVRTVPAESNEERLTREKAVTEQELQQLRRQVQTAEEGRVIGSSGVGPQGQTEPPNIGSIEPGIRFMYANNLISDDDLVNKIGPLLADLLKAHQGGAI